MSVINFLDAGKAELQVTSIWISVWAILARYVLDCKIRYVFKIKAG